VIVLSILVALWSTSSAVSTAMNAMDQICQTPRRLRRSFWRAKGISLLLTVSMLGLLLIASYFLFISDVLVKIGLTAPKLPGLRIIQTWELVRWLSAFGILTFAFSVLYRYGASHWRKGTPILPGAIIAAILWAIVSQLLRLYILYFNNLNLTYGTLSTGIVLLLWLHLNSLVVLIGAQLNVSVGKAMQQKTSRKISDPLI
jgi:membrane protein